jgi:hypothetical protein
MSAENEEEIQITEDGGLSKIILIPGHGEVPPPHARCLGTSI